MSALPVGETFTMGKSSSTSSMIMSPTDNSRHKTKILLNGWYCTCVAFYIF